VAEEGGVVREDVEEEVEEIATIIPTTNNKLLLPKWVDGVAGVVWGC